MRAIIALIAVLLGIIVWLGTIVISLSLSALTVYGGFEFGRNVLGWW